MYRRTKTKMGNSLKQLDETMLYTHGKQIRNVSRTKKELCYERCFKTKRMGESWAIIYFWVRFGTKSHNAIKLAVSRSGLIGKNLEHSEDNYGNLREKLERKQKDILNEWTDGNKNSGQVQNQLNYA